MLSRPTLTVPKTTLGLSLLMILSGCGSKEFKRIRSIAEVPKTRSFISSHTQINGSYAVFTGKMCKNYLGRNVLQKGYQPIYVTLTNYSNEAFYFSDERLDLPTVSADVVAKAAHFSSAELISSGALSATGCAVGVPLMALGAFWSVVGGIMQPKVLLLSIPTTIGAGVMTKESALEIQDSMEVNEHIDAIFEENAFEQKFIPARSTISGIIFVPKKEFHPNFTITLSDALSNTITLCSK